MRVRRLGDCVRVCCSRDDVARFASRWPCFGDIRAIGFTFDKHGDLVELNGDNGMDAAGVDALRDDAQRYAERRGVNTWPSRYCGE